MPSYYMSQGYDAPSAYIWSVLTDFQSWPEWFPNMSSLRFANDAEPRVGAELLATGDQPAEWTRWRITKWAEPSLLVCEHIESTVPVSRGIDAAYLQFELFDDEEGCTLEVEIGAEGGSLVGDFFVGMTLGTGARRMLPQLVDAFSDYVVSRAAAT
jgi:uncharacterized protein YndB with AHSA1/START domain